MQTKLTYLVLLLPEIGVLPSDLNKKNKIIQYLNTYP